MNVNIENTLAKLAKTKLLLIETEEKLKETKANTAETTLVAAIETLWEIYNSPEYVAAKIEALTLGDMPVPNKFSG